MSARNNGESPAASAGARDGFTHNDGNLRRWPPKLGLMYFNHACGGRRARRDFREVSVAKDKGSSCHDNSLVFQSCSGTYHLQRDLQHGFVREALAIGLEQFLQV